MIAASMLIVGRWGVVGSPPGTIRVDHWTGEMTLCAADLTHATSLAGLPLECRKTRGAL